MNKKTPLETLLRDYCNVNPHYKFEPELEESKMKAKKVKIFTGVACAALLLVCGTLFTIGFGNRQVLNTAQDEKASPDIVMENRDFFVKAYAEGEEKSAQKLDGTSKRINKDHPMIMKSHEGSDAKSLAADHIALEITGENIEDYSVKCENGDLHFYVFRNKSTHYLTEKNVSPDGTVRDYFALGSELFDLPADPQEINRATYLFWVPDFEKINDVTLDYDEKCALLQSAEDYNEYFGDTITISVNYKDGRTETAQIEITYDDDAYAYASISSVPEGLIIR